MSDPDWGDDDPNHVRAESYASVVVFVVGSVWWLLSERRGVYGLGVLALYVATYAVVRAWRLRRRAT